MGKHVTMTNENFDEVVKGLRENSISIITVDVEKWLKPTAPEVRQKQLTDFGQACVGNKSLERLEVSNFKFNQVDITNVVAPAQLATLLGTVMNSCENLTVVDLRGCTLHGSETLFQKTALAQFKAKRDNLQVLCKDVPSYQAIPTVNGVIFESLITADLVAPSSKNTSDDSFRNKWDKRFKETAKQPSEEPSENQSDDSNQTPGMGR